MCDCTLGIDEVQNGVWSLTWNICPLHKAAHELLEALQQVEWTNAIDGGVICPWCGNRQYDGHHQDCLRQAAIAKAEGRIE